MERIHPMREGPRARQIGRTGTSTQRWMMGVTRASLVKQHGLVVVWDGAPANVDDAVVHPRIADVADEMGVLTDRGVAAKAGEPPTMQPWARGRCNSGLVVEPVRALLTQCCGRKTGRHGRLAAPAGTAERDAGVVQCAGTVARRSWG